MNLKNILENTNFKQLNSYIDQIYEENISDLKRDIALKAIEERFEILIEAAGIDKIIIENKRHQKYSLLVRSSDSSRSGTSIQHSASLKISEPPINGENNISIIIPEPGKIMKRSDYDIRCSSDKTKKEVQKIDVIFEFIEANVTRLKELYFSTNETEYEKKLNEIITDQYNIITFKISRGGNKK